MKKLLLLLLLTGCASQPVIQPRVVEIDPLGQMIIERVQYCQDYAYWNNGKWDRCMGGGE